MTFRQLKRSGSSTADISALADGSISPERRLRIERQIEQSDELRIAFEEERATVQLLRHLRETDRAPEPLRRRVTQQRARKHRHAARPAATLGGGLAAAITASAVAVLMLAGGTAGGPSVAQAAVLATRGAAAPAPRINDQDPQVLLQRVGELYFPNWSRTLGWSAVAQRTDRLDGHEAVTVYYRSHHEHVAYTIVSVPALAQPDTRGPVIYGVGLRVLVVAGRRVVTWRRDGRTCVLSSDDVPTQQLERLAAWQPAPQAA